MLEIKIPEIRVAVSDNAKSDLITSKNHVWDNKFIAWGYSESEIEKPCQYALIYTKGNPYGKFEGVLKIEDILEPNEIPESFKPITWKESWTFYKRFYKVSRVDIIDIPMSDVRNKENEEITDVGKLRPGNFLKYVGDNPLLGYLK